MATLVVKASYEVGKDGVAFPVEDQLAISEGDAETPFGTLESDVVPIKEGCDFAVYGQAVSPRAVHRIDVLIRVGSFCRTLRVTGDRAWLPAFVGVRASEPVPFTTMPLDYTRAFGGEATYDQDLVGPEPNNALGRGFVVLASEVPGVRLPNVEESDALMTAWQQRPIPGGILPLPRSSALRGLRGVSADLKQQRTSLSPAYFQWAHPRMLLPSYPAKEAVSIIGMTPESPWKCVLPFLDLAARVQLGPKEYVLRLVPDTLAIVPSHRRLWVVSRRAFVYQYVPERARQVVLEIGVPTTVETPTTTIGAQLAASHATVPILPPDHPDRMPVPFSMLRELHPLTNIIEAFPLCASG